MFDNIGSKIKTLAQISTWIGIIGSIILGCVIGASDEDFILIGLLISVIGCVLSWISSFIIYGFGELIENSTYIIEHINTQKSNGALQKSKKNFSTTANNNNNNNNKTIKTESSSPITPIISQNDEDIICPICQTKQRNNRKVCWSCGQKFDQTNIEQDNNSTDIDNFDEIEFDSYSVVTIDDKKHWTCPECCRVNKTSDLKCKCGFKKE